MLQTIAGLILTSGLALASAATAEGTADIDMSRDGTASLTLTKLTQPLQANEPGTGRGLGEEVLSALRPLAGVEFTLARLDDIDLTTARGWDSAEALVDAPVTRANQASVTVNGQDHPTTAIGGSLRTTGADGTIAWTDLPFGVYVVTEGDDTGANGIIAGTDPFLLTLPQPDSGGWLYDVHAYPKNSVSNLTQSVDDALAFTNDDIVTWTVTAKIPVMRPGTQLNRFQIADATGQGLAYRGARVAIRGSSGSPAPSGGDGYVLAAPAPGKNGSVTASFSGESASNLPQGGTVTLTVATNAVAGGILSPTATLAINDSEPLSATASTSWGHVRIRKTDTTTAQPIEGAVFEVCATDPGTGTCPAGAIATRFTTDRDGRSPDLLLKTGTYWLVEVRTPDGYAAETEPTRIDVVPGDDALIVDVVSQPTSHGLGAAIQRATAPTGSVAAATILLAMILATAGTALTILRRRRAAGTEKP
jgi:hypothetical protein